MELLHQFTAVKNLCLIGKFALRIRIVPALQELVGSSHPAGYFFSGLRLSGPVLEGIGKFVAARKLSSHPITVFVYSKRVETDSERVWLSEADG
jgi:hypothetical protein